MQGENGGFGGDAEADGDALTQAGADVHAFFFGVCIGVEGVPAADILAVLHGDKQGTDEGQAHLSAVGVAAQH